MKIKNLFKKVLNIFWVYVLITIGSIIMVGAFNIFLTPNKLAPGGVYGIAVVSYYLSDKLIPVGFTIFALNIPLFILGYKFIGKKFFIRSLYATVASSLLTEVLQPYTDYLLEKYILMSSGVKVVPDVLLHSLVGGILLGVGLGIVLKVGSTTGGSDLLASIIHNKFHGFTVGQLILFIDSAIILGATIAFQSFQLGVYAIITLYVSSVIIDNMLEGVNFAKAVFIISDNWEPISQKILKEMGRGVTVLNGRGMYTGTDKQVVLCILQRAQIGILKQIVKEVDINSFMVLTDVREVLGEGFKEYEGV